MPTSINWYGTILAGPEAQSQLGLPVGGGGVLGMPRSDGLTDGFETIQGVRAYDSTAGAWTTPDAYSGMVTSPASQKSYMWNGNNPVMYSDPTGSTDIPEGPDGSGAQPLFTDWSMTGSVGTDLASFGQVTSKVAVDNGSANNRPDIPAGLGIDPSNTKNYGHFDVYHYQLQNASGQAVTGSGYEAMEFVEPSSCANCTSNGLWEEIEGTEIPDYVGTRDPVGPGDTASMVQFQTFSIRYQGVIYDLPNELVHRVDVLNGVVTTSVYQIVPDLMP